jgi:hypothetical protein
MTHFTEAILAASKARAAPLCVYNKQCATRLALARCTHRAAHRAYPGDPIRSHEMRHYQ